MISLALFFLILCSGSFFCAAACDKKFEELLPVTMAGSVLIIFLTGILGSLLPGVYMVMLAAAGLYLAGMVLLIRRRSFRRWLSNMLTPGFVLFCFFFVFFIYVNRGRLATFFDEFSHWVDVAKVMTVLDDFGTNPASQSRFASYPPATAIFQYLLQKLAILTGSRSEFTEWMVFTSANLFLVVGLFPLLKNYGWKQPLSAALAGAGLFLSPMILLPYTYEFAGGDAPMAMLLGAGLGYILLTKDKDWFYTLNLSLCCALLVLTKDLGILMGLFLALVAMAADLQANRPIGPGAKDRTLAILKAVLPLLALIGFRLLWNLELFTSQAPLKFQEPVDWAVVRDLILGRDQTYRGQVLHSFWRAFFYDRGPHVAHINGVVSFFLLTLAETGLLALGIRRYNRQQSRPESKGTWIAGAFLGLCLLYTLGLGLAFPIKYSQWEATTLSSFERYLCVPYVAAAVAITALWFRIAQEKEGCTWSLILLSLVLFLTPAADLWNMVGRDTVDNAKAIRRVYEPLNEKIEEAVPEDARVYFIAQEQDGFDYYVEKYSIRPRTISVDWSIGQPFYEGDQWTVQRTAEQWQQELVEGYDYVALYQINDYFVDTFGGLFEDPSAIAPDTVFVVNKETGKLELCS